MPSQEDLVALSLRGLSKAYGPTLAVDRLDRRAPELLADLSRIRETHS